MTKNAFTPVAGGAPAWVEENGSPDLADDEDRAEVAALQREVEQLACLNALCCPHQPLRGGNGAFAKASLRPRRRRNPTPRQEVATDQPIVPLLISGRHVAVVAFGPPQSGKSYTLFGSPQPAASVAAGDRKRGGTELPPLASTHTRGLITHFVRQLLDFARGRQKRLGKVATVDAEQTTTAGQIGDVDLLRAAFVAFQDDPPSAASASGQALSVFMYDLWNPASFAALQRTVRLCNSTANAGASGAEGGLAEDEAFSACSRDGSPDATKSRHAAAAVSLLVEGAMWMDVQAEDTMVAYQQRGLEHLTLLREKLHVLRVHAPLHVALLLRARPAEREARNILFNEIMAINEGPPPPPPMYHAAGVFIELQWTAAVASWSAFPPILHVAEAATATAPSDADPPSTLSLLLQNVRRWHARILLIPTIRSSPLHATDTMHALQKAVACKLSCSHPQRWFVPCTLDPVEAMRWELTNMRAELGTAKTQFSTAAEAKRRRLHALLSSIQQLTATVAERHSWARQLVLSWQHADCGSREALLRAWAKPMKKPWQLFALSDARQAEASGEDIHAEDVGAGLRRSPVYFLLLLPPPPANTLPGHRPTSLAAKQGAALESLRDLGTTTTTTPFPLFFDMNEDDLGDGSPVELSLRVRFAPGTPLSPRTHEGVVREAAVEVCLRALDGRCFLAAASLWQGGRRRTDAVPAVYVNGRPVPWQAAEKARPFATVKLPPPWEPLPLGARLVVGPYVFILASRGEATSLPFCSIGKRSPAHIQ
ncbi:uncharacterized protein Tco025E_04178 [Trypanosoma conorhini]|uniref:Kinesin n=1 Tax=Trypanosoma conorhini TaxID=83891 RepID=A0A422PNV5_9TRYP|nr:uncharacterized protein Tco025E_04178 [Trypanosoma conorhini]RNF19421.1 hypothetical protein Tco025E_04178 [Trypanosoma conorhini]